MKLLLMCAVYKCQCRFVLAVLVSAWDTAVRSGPLFLNDEIVRNYLCSSQQPNSSTAAEKKHRVTVKQFLSSLKHDCGGGAISNRVVSDTHIGAVQILALCAALQEAVTGELAHMERAVYRSRIVHQQSVAGPKAVSSRPFVGGGADAGAFDGGGSNSGGGPRPTSPVPTAAASGTTAAGGGTGPAQREVKVIYHNPASCIVKVLCLSYTVSSGARIETVHNFLVWQMLNICRQSSGGELPTPLAQLPASARNLVLDQLRDRDPHRIRVVEAVDQRLRHELGDSSNVVSNSQSKFPYNNADLLAALEPAVVRALNDLWTTMAGELDTFSSLLLCA